ncbi:SDR family NAD(P)-dependent oxidoreductase [Halosimplex halobium]|uniref:SDR family NAD(P)-dependent oxidoreductase n=1 Tax=Halosimplex halobium TaxID=3396618 RepID=UPI003F54EBA3
MSRNAGPGPEGRGERRKDGGDAGGERPVALVTGAGGGIGAAIALAFADRGWRVYATDLATPLPERVRADCETRALDVTDDERCEAVVDAVVAETGRLDCLVNNAGYAEAGPVEDVPVDAARAEFDVLVHGPHRLARAALPHMRERGRGRIVTVSSVMGLRSSPGLGAYAAGKAAVESLHDALRVELRGTGVDVSLVEPAWVDTDFADAARERLASRERTPAYARTYAALDDGWLLDGNPLATTPERVAAAVVRAAEADDPHARYPVGAFARFVRWTTWLPAPAADAIQAGYERATAALGRWLG